jgi:hypothetical protein
LLGQHVFLHREISFQACEQIVKVLFTGLLSGCYEEITIYGEQEKWENKATTLLQVLKGMSPVDFSGRRVKRQRKCTMKTSSTASNN